MGGRKKEREPEWRKESGRKRRARAAERRGKAEDVERDVGKQLKTNANKTKRAEARR